MTSCPACHGEIAEGASFCTSCGARVGVSGPGSSTSTASTSAPSPPPPAPPPPPPPPAPPQVQSPAAPGPQPTVAGPSGPPPAPTLPAPQPASGTGRRSSRLAVAAIGVLVVVGGVAAALALGGDGDGTVGTVSEGRRMNGVLQALPSGAGGEPREAWRVEAIDGWATGVVVSQGVLAVGWTDGERAFVTGLDLATGEERWQTRSLARTVDYHEPWVSLTGSGSTLYVGVSDGDERGEVLALSMSSGDEQWAHRTGPPSRVEVHGDAVVVSSYDRGDALVEVLAQRDGAVRWSTELSQVYSWVADGRTLETLDGRRMRSFDLRSGDQRWDVRVDEPRNLARFGDLILVAEADRVVAYSHRDGDEIWSERMDSVYSVLVLSEGTALVGSTDGRETFDHQGDSSWRWRRGWNHEHSLRTAGTDVALVSDHDADELILIDVADGSELGSVRTSMSDWGLQVSTDSVYVYDGRRIDALSLRDLTEQWSIRADELNGFWVVDGALVTIDWDGEVALLRS